MAMRLFFGLRSISTALFILATTIVCQGQKPFVLSDTATMHRLDTHVEIFVDHTDTVTIDQAIRFQQHFYKPEGLLTFGYLKSPVWLKVNVSTLSPRTHWYLEIPAPFLEYVDFYQLNGDGSWHHSQSGYYRKHSIKALSHTGHALSLRFGADSASTVYIRIAGQSPKTFPLLAVAEARFFEGVRLQDVGYGIFFGILAVMFFYNLFIYLTLRQTNYLLYICTIVCTFFVFAAASGYAGKFLWPENPILNFYFGRMSLGVMAIFLAVFTIRFLEVRKYSQVMYVALLSLIPLAAIATVLVATKILSSAGNNLISLSTVMFMITGIVCRIKGNKTASYFIMAWAIYLIGGLLLTLRNSGVFDFNFWTTHFVEVGAVLETVIIAFALGDRYRRYEQEKDEAQRHALMVQQEANEKLEIKVKERTEQLSKAYEELRATLETNQQQTEVIENKNAELDAFFYRISHDLKGPILSLLGLSSLARREIKDERALEYILQQQGQVERLNNIISGLIQLTKLNHKDLQKEKINFHKMIDECIVSFHGLENFARLAFRKDIQPGVEFYSEWTLLNAILQNLIENAIKYAREDSPYCHVIVRYESGFLVIRVEDNGQGIPQEHQSRVFEMFYRATQNAQGTGLGLYILKRSVDKLKGTVDVHSEVGVGSTFTVKLPG